MLNEQPLEIQPQDYTKHIDIAGLLATRNILFVLFIVASVIIYWTPLKSLAGLSLHSEEYSYIGMMPPLALFLFYVERRKIFANVRYSLVSGALLLLPGFILDVVANLTPIGHEAQLFLQILSLVTVWAGGLALFYGTQTLQCGSFPLLFIFLMLPLPQSVIEKPLDVIQHGSAEVVNIFLDLSGVPFFRDGFNFSLTGLEMVVAPQCAGIHSTLALLIASLLIGHFYFKSARARAFLILAVFPIVSLTNGFRIFGLSILSVYVSMDFFKGDLHRNGGIMFFLLGLVLLAYVARLLRDRGRSGQTKSKA
jgi:exosortase